MQEFGQGNQWVRQGQRRVSWQMFCHFGSRHFLLEISFVICSQWVSLCFGLMVFVCARKKCWQTPSRSMGSVNYVPNPICGRGGAAGDATATPRQECSDNTARRLRRERVSGPLVLRRQVEEKRSPKFRRHGPKSFVPRLSSFGSNREERQDKKDTVTWQEGKVVLRKTGVWIVRMRSRPKRSWMSREKGCRSNCVNS